MIDRMLEYLHTNTVDIPIKSGVSSSKLYPVDLLNQGSAPIGVATGRPRLLLAVQHNTICLACQSLPYQTQALVPDRLGRGGGPCGGILELPRSHIK